MRIYKLYATVSADGANQANCAIQARGRIRMVSWSVGIDAPADNAAIDAEVSFAARTTDLLASNSVGPFSQVSAISNGSVTAIGAVHKQDLVDVPTGPGDVVYLNALVDGTVSARITVFLHVEEGR